MRGFTAADIQETIPSEPPSERTIRAALNSMVELELLNAEGGVGSAPREYFPVKPNTPLEPTGYQSQSRTQRASFPWPGSKAHLADWIVENMAAHETYVEVFAGAAGVLFSKPKSKYEIVNDLSKDIVQFFEVLRNRGEELAEWLLSVPYSRDLYEEWAIEFYSHHRPDDPIERAGRFYSLRYMQFSGVASAKNGFKVRARRSPARSFHNAKQQLDAFADRLAEVIIEQRDYRAILDGYDDESVQTLFYLDPPYDGVDNQYGAGVDSTELVNALNSVENDWMLSCLTVPEGLDYDTVLSKDSRHQIRQDDGKVTEQLVCNFNPEDRTSFTSNSMPNK